MDRNPSFAIITGVTVQQRRERDLAHRRSLIISAARELAESEGWSAVTTRRLAEVIEYSQPVLYKHFSGKDDIVRAVAIEGFVQLTSALRDTRRTAATPAAALRAFAETYVDFATANPQLYEAMFSIPVDLSFGWPDSPPALVEAFAELRAVVAAVARGRDIDSLAEFGLGVPVRPGGPPAERTATAAP